MLELVFEKQDFFTYELCGSTTGGTTFCNGTNIYRHSIAQGPAHGIYWIYYSEQLDRVVFLGRLATIDFTGLEYNIYTIHPETGSLELIFRGTSGGIGFAIQLQNQWTLANGGQGRLYAYRSPLGGGEAVMNISRTHYPFYTDYELANPLLTPTDIPNLDANQTIGPTISWVNRAYMQVGLGPFVSGIENILEVYDIDTGNYRHGLTLPELVPLGTAWEDDERMWMLCAEASSNSTRQTLVKYNFKYNVVELMTELQKGTTNDHQTMFAFDTKRKKICAVRIKDDSANGKYNNFYQVYAPQPVMSNLTVPVAIDIVGPTNEKSHFLTTLRGTKGESGGSRLLTVSKTGSGTLVQNEIFTKKNGVGTVEYLGGTAGGSVTITVEHNETRST